MPRPISITNWKRGIAETPAVGFGIVKADIKRDGYLRANQNVDNMKDNFTNRIKHIVQDPVNGGIYAFDGDGNLFQKSSNDWNSIGNVETTQSEGNGLEIYKDYIFKARRNRIDVAPVTNPSNWTDDWATLNAQGYSNVRHPMLRSENDKLYIGDGRYVHEVDAGDSFDPSSDSMTSNVLDLPANYVITGLEEYGKYLVILAEQPTAGRVAVFPWDKTSSSFNLPVFINESKAHGIKVQLGTIFVLAGNSVYTTSLSSSRKVFDFDFLQNDTDFIEIPDFGDNPMDFDGDDLLIGVGNNTYSSIAPVGLYSLEGSLSLRAGISTGSDGSGGGNVIVDTVFVSDDEEIMFGWSDNGTYGIDIITTQRDRQYNSYLESELFSISRSTNPTSYQTIEVYLNTRLTSGDGFRISYRESTQDDWTLIKDGVVTDGDYDFDALGAVSSHTIPATLPNVSTLQFKLEMKRDVNIKEVIIR